MQKNILNNILFFLFSWFFIFKGFSQEKEKLINDLEFEVKGRYGFLQPHHYDMRYLIDYNTRGLEFTISTNAYGRHNWEALYRYPKFGLGGLYLDLGNKDVYGHAYGVFAFLNIPIVKWKDKWSFSYQIDFGTAYLTKKFDIENNPLNTAISSHVNVLVGLDFALGYKINSKNAITTGFDLTHLSNGKIGSPNLGLNYMTLNMSYQRQLRESRFEQKIYQDINNHRKHFFEMGVNAGTRSDDWVSGNYYLTSSLIFDYKYALSLKYQTGLGIDFFYDESLPSTKEHEIGEPGEPKDKYQMGIHATISPRYNKLNVIVQVGTYLYSNFHKYSPVYSRIGMRYFVHKHIYLNISLKAHLAIADYIEWGIGYRL